MWPGNTQQSTPFGGGGFGQSQQQQGQPFGSPPAGGGLFGQSQQQQPATGFGTPAPASFASGAPTSTFGGGSTFGGTNNAFGQAPAGGGMFGSPPAAAPPATGFGTFSAPAPSGLFGQSSAPAPFGAPSAGGGGLFSPAPAPGSMFGGTSNPQFGGTGTFGSTAPAPSTGMFGGAAPASAFGATTNSTTTAFGTTPATSSFGVGLGTPASAPAFGSTAPTPAPGLFGGSPATNTPFGAPPASTGFGATSTPASMGGFATPGMGSPATGTKGLPSPFAPVPKSDTGTNGVTTTLKFHSITAMQQFQNKSFEELRLEDYMQNNRGQTPPTSNTPGSSSLFGNQAPAPTGGLFGAAPAPQGGLFGAPAAPAFGAAPTPGTGLFGSNTAAPAPAGAFGGFGSNTPAAGTPTSSFGGFGAPNTSVGAPSAFGSAPSAGFSSFGSTPAPATTFGTQPASGGSLFGNAPASAPFGSTAPAPFGAQPPQGGGLFGNAPAASPAFGGGFGGSVPAPAPFAGFGAQSPQSNFGQTGPNAFGQQNQQAFGGTNFGNPQQLQFGQQNQGQPSQLSGVQGQQQVQGSAQNAVQQPPAPMFSPNMNIIPQNIAESQKRHAEMLKNMYDEVDKKRAWFPDNNSPTANQIGVPPPNGGLNIPRTPYAISAASMMSSSSRSPRSGAKFKPRGYSWSGRSGEDATPRAKISELGRSGSSTGRSKHMQLVVKPNSLAPPRLNLGGQRLSVSNQNESIASPPPNVPVNGPATSHGPSLTPLAASDATTPTATGATSHQQQLTSPQPSPAATALYSAATADEPGPIQSPPPRDPVASGMVPTLTLEGYECLPSIDDLATMSEGDLAAVTGFVVRRPGYGEVAWEGAVDVRGINLDTVVSIKPRDVSVYQEAEDEGTKPDIGTKLNRPAIITFEEIFPGDDPQASPATMDKFVEKLKKMCARMNADFIDYDRGTGAWRIRVEHFSRYGLFDDDEEDEDEPMVNNVQRKVNFAPGATPAKGTNKSILQRKQTPYAKAIRVGFEDDEVEYSVSDDVEMSEEDVIHAVDANAQATYEAVFANVQDSILSSKAKRRHEFSGSAHVVEDNLVEDAGHLALYPKPTRELLSEASKSGSITSRLRIPRTSINYSLIQGTTLRPGWSLAGRVYLPSGSQIGPSFDECTSELSEILLKFKSICRVFHTNDIDCPLLEGPRALQNGGDEESHAALLDFLEVLGASDLNNEEAEGAFRLLAALLETPESSSAMVLAGQPEHMSYSFTERRNHALLRWLVSVNAPIVEREVQMALAQNNLPRAIFSALSGGDVKKAAEIAFDGGAVDLSLALSTGSEGVSTLARMVSRVSGLRESVPQYLVRSLRAFCGQQSLEESLYRAGNNLVWQQRLALLLLQYPLLSLPSLLSKYDESVKQGTAPFPSPQYETQKLGVESVQYRILRVIADPQSVDLSTVANTNGFWTNHHNFSLSFLLAVTLIGSGFVSAEDPFKFELIVDGLEAQLLANGLWELATVVCLCASGPVTDAVHIAKSARAHNYLLRFHQENDGARHELSFLPDSWFAKALAYKAGSGKEFMARLNDFDSDAATPLIERSLLPDCFFGKNMEAIFAQSDGAEPGSVTASIQRLVGLSSEVRSLVGSSDGIESMLDECANLETVFRSALAADSQNNGLSPASTASRIDFKFMLREALNRIDMLRFFIASVGVSSTNESS